MTDIIESGDRDKGAVEKPRPVFEDTTLREIASWDQAIQLAAEEFGGEIVSSNELGNGFTVLSHDEKDKLVDVPLFFLQWDYNLGDYVNEEGQKTEFASAYVIAKWPGGGTPGKFILNDGGSGIYKQLREFSNRTGRKGGLLAARGLTKSEYDHPQYGFGTTYYINTSPPKKWPAVIAE